ncbi:MAG: lipoprotein [Pseudomonadales bacterium]
MRRLVLPTFLAISVIVLAACGQKGPLYLPNKPEAEPSPPAQDNSAEEHADATNETSPVEPDQ